jgi:hypothetical protein
MSTSDVRSDSVSVDLDVPGSFEVVAGVTDLLPGVTDLLPGVTDLLSGVTDLLPGVMDLSADGVILCCRTKLFSALACERFALAPGLMGEANRLPTAIP